MAGSETKSLKGSRPSLTSERAINLTRQRLKADRALKLQPVVEQRHTIPALLERIRLTPKDTSQVLSSDPIQSFSSSPHSYGTEETSFGAPSELLRSQATPSPATRTSVALVPPSSDPSDSPEESDTDELPDVSALLEEQAQKIAEAKRIQEEKERAKKLAEAKRLAIALQRQRNTPESDGDLELEIVDEEVNLQDYAHSRAKPSEAKKKLLSARSTKHARQDLPKKRGEPALLFSRKDGAGTTHSQQELSKSLLGRANADRETIVRKKEEEWLKRGGRLAARNVDGSTGKEAAGFEIAIKAYADKGLAERMEIDGNESEAGTENDSDKEFLPEERGSASPELSGNDEEDAGEIREEEDGDLEEENVGLWDILDGKQTYSEDDDIEDQENAIPRAPHRVSARTRVIVDSDEEDDQETRHPYDSCSGMTPPEVLRGLHRGSLSSTDEPTEDENDKENDTRRMFDKSDDKENKAVVRHNPLSLAGGSRPPLGAIGGSLFGLEESIRRGLSMSPGPRELDDDDDDDETAERSPLKELSKATDDPFDLSSPKFCATSFTARLLLSPGSPRATSPRISPIATLPLSLAPAPLLNDNAKSSFSQFSDEGENDNENENIAPKALSPHLSQFFGSEAGPSELRSLFNSSKPTGLSQFLQSEEQSGPGLARLRYGEAEAELSLTLDVGLQPALELDESRRKEADNVFEREQLYVVEAANRKPQKKAELYVNEHGFLTQTRPNVSSPDVYRVSPSQRPSVFATQRSVIETPVTSHLSRRRPLQTLSFSEDPDITLTDDVPLMRLRKRSVSPSQNSPVGKHDRSPLSSPLKSINAFDVLLKGQRSPRSPKKKKKLGKSDFVAAEAVESDDDEMLGFGVSKKKDDDEESEGEDLDKTLEDLVDDQEMDEKTENRELVLEKVKEHLMEDDQRLEKLHRDAIEGKMRIKRRDRGVGFDDDSEDDDDDEARQIRRRMPKKRKIEGDNLEELGQDPETKAFYNAYNPVEEDEEFAHLNDIGAAITMADGTDEEEPREEISIHEIRRQAREMAQRDEFEESMDPHDVSWVDGLMSDDDNGELRVKSIRPARRKPERQRAVLPGDDDLEFFDRPAEDAPQRALLAQWAKTERSSRNIGTGRSAVGAAVTGHGKAKLKTGGGSLRTAQQATLRSEKNREKPKLAKAPSVLAGVPNRTSRFA